MAWKEEHGSGYEVPGFVLWLTRKGILQDDSWRNDTCPRFALAHGDDAERGVSLWIEHPLKSRRENLEERFLVTDGEFTSDVREDDQFVTDDLEEALLFVFERMKKYRPDLLVDGEPDGDYNLQNRIAEYLGE